MAKESKIRSNYDYQAVIGGHYKGTDLDRGGQSTQNPIFRQKPEILGFRSCRPVSISQQN